MGKEEERYRWKKAEIRRRGRKEGAERQGERRRRAARLLKDTKSEKIEFYHRYTDLYIQMFC